MKRVAGGMLVQDVDNRLLGDRAQGGHRARALREGDGRPDAGLAHRQAHQDNGIAVAKDNTLPGRRSRAESTASGPRSRRWSAQAKRSRGAALASGRLLPPDDCVEAAAGGHHHHHPARRLHSGSGLRRRLQHGIAMVFTGMRHFKHS